MSQKYSIKAVVNGSTKKVSLVSPGAGQAGNALVIQATENTRFQLMDVVTQSSPGKLKMKRVGDALHLALPNGGDIDAPDIVIQNYYATLGTTIWGNDTSGEWQRYATDNLTPASASADASQRSWLSSMFDKDSSSVGLEKASFDWMGMIESPWTIVGLAGAAGAYKLYDRQQNKDKESAAAASTDSSKPEVAALDTLKKFTNDTGAIGSKSADTPSLTDYSNLGIKAMNSLSDPATRVALQSNTGAAATPLTATILNSTIDRIPSSELSKERVQKAADSWFRILKVADGSTTANIEAYPNEINASDRGLKASDYANIGVTVKDATGKQLTLQLLNEVVGRLSSNKLDSAEKLQLLAETVNDIFLLAKNSPPNLSDTQLVDGLNAILGSTLVKASNLEAVKKALQASNNDGTDVDTVEEVTKLLKPELALQMMRTFTDDTAAIGSKTASNVSLNVYTDLGINAYNWPDMVDADRVDLSKTTLTESILNTALDRISGSDISKDRIQKMVDSYTRLLKVADSKESKTDAYPESTQEDLQISDYSNLGINVGNAIGDASNKTLALLNDAVGRVVSGGKSDVANTKVDTVEEIDLLAKTADDVMALAKGGAAKQSDTDFIKGLNALLDITGLKIEHLSAIKAALAATKDDGTEVDTVTELKDLIKPITALQYLKEFTEDTAAIGSKSSASPALQTYKDLGVKMFASLNNTTDAGRVDLDTNLVNGAATVTALNSAIDRLDAASLTKDKVQALVDSYFRILSEADGKPDVDVDVYPNDTGLDDPSLTDYANIGVTIDTTVANTLVLVNDAVGRLSATSVDTADEVNAIAVAAKNVMAKATGGTISYTTNAEWIAGLTALGVTGVTANNIDRLLASIAGTGAQGAAVDTVSEIQTLVSLEKLRDFDADTAALANKTASTPTLADWTAVGLEANTSLTDGARVKLSDGGFWKNTNNPNGINALNSALDALGAPTKTYNKDTLQKIVDSYGRILQAADGSRTTVTDVSKVGSSTDSKPTLSDFQNIGVTVDSATGVSDLLIDVVGAVSSGKVDSVEKLNKLAKSAKEIISLALTDSTSLTDTELREVLNNNGFGLSNLTNDNIADIKAAIIAKNAATDVDTLAELQSIIGLTNINRYAQLSSNGPPAFDDYKSVENNAIAGNKGAYDTVVDIKSGNITQSQLSDMINSYNKIIAEANGTAPDATADDPTRQDYLNIGLADLREDVVNKQLSIGAATHNSFIKLLGDTIGSRTVEAVDALADINSLAKTSARLMDLAFKSGAASSSDLGSVSVADLKAMGLNIDMLMNSSTVDTQRLNNFTQRVINSDDNGSGVDTLDELQLLINQSNNTII